MNRHKHIKEPENREETTMIRLLSAFVIALAMAAGPARAEPKEINLTVASSHPLVVPWVGFIKSVFMAEVDAKLAQAGNYKINWNEAFGGQLYKANATLTSVEEGITDIGWVFSYLEGAKMPLSQVAAYTPFTTNDVPRLLDTMTELMDAVPAFRKEWEQYNLVFLGATAADDYDLYTNFPVTKLSDLDGRKISAPGVLAAWLRGMNVTAVNGALTTYYTDIQTGVSEGTLSIALGILPTKTYEVAPYITRVNAGVVFSGGLAINRDSWNTLPEEVQKAMVEAGRTYSQKHAVNLMERHEFALDKMVEIGKDQSPPVTITPLPAEERRKWVDGLPNIAKDWADAAEAKGLPGREFLKAYLAGLKARGETPGRDWEEGL
jgi:TRAP-type C4-dicarboxylate transport system substrate-binding protein